MIAVPKPILWKWAVFFLGASTMLFLGVMDPQTRDALKVLRLLKTIEDSPHRSGPSEQSAGITESELNAYIAFLLAHTENSVIRHAVVDLLDNNQVKGVILLDAQALGLGLVFGDRLELAFSAELQSQNRTARLNLTALALNEQPINPKLTQLILGQVTNAASWYYGTPVTGLEDEYALPPGVKRIAVKKAGLILYY